MVLPRSWLTLFRSRRHTRRPPRRAPWRPRLEALEGLLLPSAYVVTTADDAGPGSLRQAILDANADPGPNAITFQIDPGGPQLITLRSELPASTTPVAIDGTTQPGFAGCPLIELDGSGAGQGANGLILDANQSTVRGFVIHSFTGAGIWLNGGNANVVAGNYLGTDLSGTVALGNGTGVRITAGRTFNGFNRIGGTTDADRNVIAGNRYGVRMEGANTTGNLVEGNYLGTDVTGTAPLGNAVGVYVPSATDNPRVGGSTPGAGNLISGNGTGVFFGSQVAGGVIQGNLIGTDVTGTAALGNGVGVQFFESTHGDRIDGNVISGNLGAGISMSALGQEVGITVEGNFIGTDITGSCPLGNGGAGVSIDGNFARSGTSVSGNLVAYNGGDGIAIGGEALTMTQPNFVRDNVITDNGGRGVAVSLIRRVDISGNVMVGNAGGGIALTGGANHDQEFPEIATATSDGKVTTITGTLTSAANTTFTLEFFANSACDPSGYGQGEAPLGTAVAQTGADGTADFIVTFDAVDVGAFITATATDAQDNTSSFSACVTVTAPDGERPPVRAGGRGRSAPWLFTPGSGLRPDGSGSVVKPQGQQPADSWDWNRDMDAVSFADAAVSPGTGHAGPQGRPRGTLSPAHKERELRVVAGVGGLIHDPVDGVGS